MTSDMQAEKVQAARWFKTLRDDIVTAFQSLEDSHSVGPMNDKSAGTFEVTKTTRHSDDGTDAGGGEMSVMRGGRVFEKVGVNISTVVGTSRASRAQAAMAARKGIEGMAEDPQGFWASGISLGRTHAEPALPSGPYEHADCFGRRMHGGSAGGSDLESLVLSMKKTRRIFIKPSKDSLDPHGREHYPKASKAWADEYFYIPTSRSSARCRRHLSWMTNRCTGNWDADFKLTQDIGRAFLPAYQPLIEKRRVDDWSEADKDAQLVHRGLYAEYNLVYDRGTKFGLETGHDANAVLMSLPPLAKWV